MIHLRASAGAALMVGVVLCALLHAAAQDVPTFRAVVDVVTIDAFAHRDRQPIEGLTAADFVVLDNGVEQRIDAVGSTDSAHIVIGLDLSGSVDGAVLDRLRTAIRAVTAQLTPRDRLSVFTFADRLRVLAQASEPDASLDARLDRLVATGATTLHDAVVLGSTLARVDERPAVFLLFTDGQDTASWSTASRALDVLRRADVVVYPVAAGLPAALIGQPTTPYFTHPTWVAPGGGDTLRLLQTVADLSGGEFLRVGRDDRLSETFAGILAQYRQRYLLSFTPRGATRGGWHRLEVRLRKGPGTVVAREGYMARPQ